MRVKFEATDATGKVHKRSSKSHAYSHCLVIHCTPPTPSNLWPRASRPAATPNGLQAVRWPNASQSTTSRHLDSPAIKAPQKHELFNCEP